ncbi:outer membrane lipoprotein chaperone LolA [Pseudoalteromonas fenneropenaei]|uniref:Outer-membrane lipoprotein carrier protein n=1 Tax=Pseudoalteromonas fenneropenaei TaxID=1737459 RepID=A0ABV7CFN1_9GAMM
MKKLLLSVLAMGVLSTPNFAFAEQTVDAKMVLQQKLAELKSFQARFNQVVTDEQGSPVMNAEGKLLLQAPLKIRWQQESPDDTLFVSDGNKGYFYDSFAEQVTVMNASALVAQTPFVLLTSEDPNDWQKYDIAMVGQAFVIVPKPDSGAQVEKLEVRFSDSGALSSLNLKDVSGQLSRFTFSEVASNVEIAASQFTFTIPDGVAIDDQTQGE